MKRNCDTCKNFLLCDSFCFNQNYEPSIRKLIKRKIRKTIIRLLRL